MSESTADAYYIDFNSRINPGKLEAVKVTIQIETLSDLTQELRIDLCDHPLYPELARYVKNNPPGSSGFKYVTDGRTLPEP